MPATESTTAHDLVRAQAREHALELRTTHLTITDLELLGSIILEMRIEAVAAQGFSPDCEAALEDAEEAYMDELCSVLTVSEIDRVYAALAA